MRPVILGLLLAVLFGIVGGFASLTGSTSYSSKTIMLINDPYSLATSGAASEFTNLAALRYKYAGLVNTYPIAQPVATQLHLPVNAVLGAISAQVPVESLLMEIDATWSTPQGAQVLSQAVANQVTSYVEAENATYQIPAPHQFTFTTVDPASAAVAQHPSENKAITFAIGLAILGFGLGYLGTQVARYLR